jgi:capsular polysaccharide transport system permease protein
MTTKPKAKKFRVRRDATPAAPRSETATATSAPASQPVSQPASPPASSAPTQPQAATVGLPKRGAPRPRTQAAATPPASPAQQTPTTDAPQTEVATDIDAIRQEGLTGRQLRMARRVAQKQGLAPVSDFDAVRLLRLKGIDPFKRSNVLELVVGEGDSPATGATAQPTPGPGPIKPGAPVQLPQTIKPETQQLPSTQTASPAERRAAEIQQIQKDLAARRRKKSMLLLTRLAFFVGLPTLIAGYYFYFIATPMYATKSEFLILKAESGGGAMGSLFSGTQFATNQDAIAVQSYLKSKDAMLRLDQDVGFKSHFTLPEIDPVQRLSDNPTNEEAYKLYKRNIEIGYDPTEGVIRMEIMAADPEVAAQYSRALIGYAEERVDNLSLRKRSNAVQDAEQGLRDAETGRRNAQEKLVRLQQEGGLADPEGRIAALRAQINTYELQLQEKRLQLQALLDNTRPNRAKVEGTQGDIGRLESLLAELNSEMISATSGEESLAEKAVQIRLAEADLATRDLMLQTALERLEQARRDADSQARYLTTSVEPVASEDPSYPRSFENTILAFLIFGGAYLMVSLTASILREQVTS